jgi:hypothetical protein
MGNVTSSIYGAFFLILVKLSEKFQKQTQDNLNLQDNHKENLLDSNYQNTYKNVDIEKNNKTVQQNEKRKDSLFLFFGKSNNKDKETTNHNSKYQLLKNSEYDFETNDLNKKYQKNFEILKQEIKQCDYELDEECIIEGDKYQKNPVKNKDLLINETSINEKLISINLQDNKIKGNKTNKNVSKSNTIIDNKHINLSSNNLDVGANETFEDLRKQILEDKFEDEEI